MLLGGCVTTEADRNSLRAGFARYSDNQAEEAEGIADRFITANPNADTVDEAYYLRGLARMSRGNRGPAAADLRTAISKTKRADLKGKAYRALGDIAKELLQWPESQKDYEDSLATGAMSAANVTYLNYGIGVALQAQGQWAQARPYFVRVAAADNDAERKVKALARMDVTAFTLQYGAYKDANNARNKVAQLKTAGVNAAMASEMRASEVWFLVQAGAYHTFAEAAAAREQMRTKLADVVVIVP